MTDTSWLGPSIDVRSLFAGQQAAFVALLRGLRPEQWAQPTVCPGWDVKDIAAHVLGDHVGRLSRPARNTSGPSSIPSCAPCRTPCATRAPRRAPSWRWP